MHLAIKGIDDLTLVDVIKGLPQGEAMDIEQMLSAYGTDIEVRGSNEYSDIRGSDLVIVAAGFGRKPGQTRLDLMNSNAGIIREVCERVREYAPDSKLLMVTNPLDVMTYIAFKVTQFKRNRLFGMSGTLDGARLKHFLSKELGVSKSSITPMIIGEHGDTMLPLTKYTTIGGIPSSQLLSKEKFSEIIDKTRGVAAEVIAKKGATIHAPAAAVTLLVDSLINDRKSVYNVSAYLDGEYGYSDVVMDMPVVLGGEGIEKILELELDDYEREQLNKSYDTLKDAISKLNLASLAK